jgi:hypothetical protein
VNPVINQGLSEDLNTAACGVEIFSSVGLFIEKDSRLCGVVLIVEYILLFIFWLDRILVKEFLSKPIRVHLKRLNSVL